MRVGIDARFYGDFGIGRVLVNLLENLERIDHETDYVVFLRANKLDLYQPKEANFKKVSANVGWYSLQEQILLPRIFSKEKLDLLFVPHINIPIFYPGKMVVMIHDLIITEFKGQKATLRNPLIYNFKHLSYQVVLNRAVKKAAKLIVPSQVVAEKLIGKFSISEEKIVVIPEAADETFSQKELTTPEKEVIKEKYKVKDFVLAVGNNSPHKNLELLIQTATHLKGIKIVLVSPDNEFLNRLKRQAIDSGVLEKIVFTGRVGDQELRDLYQTANAFVFPSLEEGFGLPGLEAMSAELPVLASDIPVFKEVYGEAAMYFDPHDPEDLAARISVLLKEKNIREKYSQLGRDQVKKYSWEKFAQQTLNVFQGVLANLR